MLRPTFLSFETAKRALSTSQLGLDTVGHNISNVNTPGYSRQRVDQVSISSSGYKSKYQAFGVQFPGQGSQVMGINQVRDPFLDKRYRTEAAGCGQYSATSQGLAEINDVFDEIMSTGNHAKMGEFLAELQTLIESADSKEQATVLRNKAQQIAQVLNKNAVDLDNVQTQQRSELGYAVDTVNSILEQIAMLNVKIKEDHFYGNPSNELMDERNLLLDQLSEYVDIDIKNTPLKVTNDVTVSIMSVYVKGTDINLVDSGEYNNLRADVDKDGNSTIHLVDGISGLGIKYPNAEGSSDITKHFMTGAVKGHLDILNGKGVYADNGENSFRGIPYYRQALDDYAEAFADLLNEFNRIPVVGLDGKPALDADSNPIYLEMPLFQTNDGSDRFTAANLAVSQQWLENGAFINTTAADGSPQMSAGGKLMIVNEDGDTVESSIAWGDVARISPEGYLLNDAGEIIEDTGTGIKVNITDLYRVDSDGNAMPAKVPGAAANDNLLALKMALNADIQFPNGFKGSFQKYMVSFEGDMSLDQEQTDALFAATYKVLSGLADSRDSVSAVNIDEEGISMMTYQNYYNAAARYMTVLDEALGTIIQGMGVVGR